MSESIDPAIPPLPPEEPSNTPWGDRVTYSRRAGGYARRRNRIWCGDGPSRLAVEAVTRVTSNDDQYGSFQIHPESEELGFLHRFPEEAGVSVEDLVDRFRGTSVQVDPDYVLFANPVYANPVYANPVYANPVYANPVYANPVYANPADEHSSGQFANPVYANPVYASPVYANPVYANPVYANPYICDGTRPSTARPAAPPDRAVDPYVSNTAPIKVIILDTGISAATWCPPVLTALSNEYPGQTEQPDGNPPSNPEDGFLDPVSGHGTFIAGIIQALAPSHQIIPRQVVGSYGDVSVTAVIQQLAMLQIAGELDQNTIVNMSFGGYADEEMPALSRALASVRFTGAACIASAGNDATSRPMFPACLPGVVGVASIDRHGAAPYSNRGPWVSACAPGSDLVAAFYDYQGEMELPPMPGSSDPDDYEDWARWTGTSFAAPVVVAALMRHMSITGDTAAQAVESVIDAPALFRMPNLGTVVNLTTEGHSCL